MKGSREAPKRFFSLRQFFATPRISPDERLRHTTILLAFGKVVGAQDQGPRFRIATSEKSKPESRKIITE